MNVLKHVFISLIFTKLEFLCITSDYALDQLCPTRGHRAACGPAEGFVRPCLDFRCSKSILHTANLS